MIRPARPEDREPVLAFCQDTWGPGSGDYIEQAWESWLADPGVQLFAVQEAAIPVGILCVRFLNTEEAWLQGLRIHPQHRRHGLARALTLTALDAVRAQGCRSVRLATAADNAGGRAVSEGVGFYREAVLDRFEAIPAVASRQDVRLGTEKDLAQVRHLWSHLPRATGLLVQSWVWRKIRWEDLEDRTRAGHILLHSRALGAWMLSRGRELTLEAPWLQGEPEGIAAFARALRGLAIEQGAESIEVMAPAESSFGPILEAAGFNRHVRMLIYRLNLSAPPEPLDSHRRTR